MKKKGKNDKNKLQEKTESENNIILQKKTLRVEKNFNLDKYTNKKTKKKNINVLNETIQKDINNKEIKIQEENVSNPDNIKSNKKIN